MIGEEKLNTVTKSAASISIGDLVVPSLGVIILVILIVFIYIPVSKDLSKYQKDIADIETEIGKIESNANTLSSIDTTLLNKDKQIINQLIPERLEVASFAIYVEKLAIEKNLELTKLSASSSLRAAGETEENGVYAISGSFVYTGSYEAVLDFVKSLSQNSPYLISASNIKLSDIGEGSWTVELIIEGYYSKISSATDIQLDQDIRDFIYDQNSPTLDRLRNRSK